MEMLTNNIILYVSYFFCGWGALCLLAYFLIQFRRDSDFVVEDMNKFLVKHGYPFRFFSAILLFLILPISIPYSLAHIFRK